MDRRPTFNFDSTKSRARLVAWSSHWPRKVLAATLCMVALGVAVSRHDTAPVNRPNPSPTPRPDLTAGLTPDQRAVSLGILSPRTQLIRPGDVVDLLASFATESFVSGSFVSGSSISSEPANRPRAQVVAESVRVLAITGEQDGCSVSEDGSADPLRSKAGSLNPNPLSLVVAASTVQALGIASYASGVVVATVHPRQ